MRKKTGKKNKFILLLTTKQIVDVLKLLYKNKGHFG